MASVALRDWVPDSDAVVVERVRKAGAGILGKTNTPEFASTFATNNRLFGPTHNPWNLEHSAGGSSGGAGAAVASGLGPIGHGNDFAGSIRVPSSFCGIFGIKPTMGRIPNNSYTAGLQCFSHEGPLTRTVGDAALFLSVCAGPDPRDPWAIEETPPDFLGTLDEPLAGLRIAWSESFGGAATDASVLAACEDAARWLAKRVGRGSLAPATPDLSGLAESMAAVFGVDNYVMAVSLLGDRLGDIGGLVQKSFAQAQALSAADYALALGKVARFRYNMRRFFEGYDLLLTPVTRGAGVPHRRPDLGHRAQDAAGGHPQVHVHAAVRHVGESGGVGAGGVHAGWPAHRPARGGTLGRRDDCAAGGALSGARAAVGAAAAAGAKLAALRQAATRRPSRRAAPSRRRRLRRRGPARAAPAPCSTRAG